MSKIILTMKIKSNYLNNVQICSQVVVKLK